jgi:hypothetical protein
VGAFDGVHILKEITLHARYFYFSLLLHLKKKQRKQISQSVKASTRTLRPRKKQQISSKTNTVTFGTKPFEMS